MTLVVPQTVPDSAPQSGAKPLPKSRFLSSSFGRLTVAIVLILGLGLAALPSVERFSLVRSGEQGMATLRLSVEGLRGALQRFEPLPALIGERPNLSAFLQDPTNAALGARINSELLQTSQAIGASDVYLMDANGVTIATSNYLKERTFLGRSFAFRPYFTQAIAGGIGRYFALGTTSLERGYFYAAPVHHDGQIIGVLTLKFTVDAFETAWRGGTSDIVVTDASDIIFMASREDWHFRTLSALNDEQRTAIAQTQQYPLDQLQLLDNERTALSADLDLMTVREGRSHEAFVTASQALDTVGWRVHVLVPAGPALGQAAMALLVFVLGVLLVGLVLFTVLQRRARILERLEAQHAAQALLERRVDERTADLNTANTKLRSEVDERKTAEMRLRKTQKELIQAGKLAALGQMSAALSHEINQPLAAVKSYADNTHAFLERGRLDEAQDNVARISQMADRMAAISSHLRNFARRPQDDVGPIDLCAAIDDALALMEVRFKASNTQLIYAPLPDPIWVMGGRLRLQQVIVNLLNNAVDATLEEVMLAADESNDPACIELRVAKQPNAEGEMHVRLDVLDRGSGLDEATLASVFDPFFTTKSPGKGLGLGLSISYNILEDFGGRLRAQNREGGGAVFSMHLRCADSPHSDDPQSDDRHRAAHSNRLEPNALEPGVLAAQ